MRQALASLLRRLFEALVRLYYPTRSAAGAGRIPSGVPLIFVLGHPNGLLDPLVLRVAIGRPTRHFDNRRLADRRRALADDVARALREVPPR